MQNRASKIGVWHRVVTSFREWQVRVYSFARLCTIFELYFYLFTVNKGESRIKYRASMGKGKTQTCHSRSDVTTLSQTPVLLARFCTCPEVKFHILRRLKQGEEKSISRFYM